MSITLDQVQSIHSYGLISESPNRIVIKLELESQKTVAKAEISGLHERIMSNNEISQEETQTAVRERLEAERRISDLSEQIQTLQLLI